MTAPCPAYGFHVQMALRPGLVPAERERLLAQWEELLENRGLSSGGRGPTYGWIVTSEASQATDDDRSAVRAWLESRPELKSWSVGELVDLRDMR